MKFPSNPAYIAWIYLTALSLGYILGGWLLADFNAPWFIWVGTQAVTWHLGRAGSDAIALALAWVVAIEWAGAYSVSMPKVLPDYIPLQKGAVWASTLLLSWLLAIVLVSILAFAGRPMRSLGLNKAQASYSLVLITWVALGLGWLIYGWILPGSSY